MSREHWSWSVWGSISVIIAVPEILAAVNLTPWWTISTTVMSLQARWEVLTVPILAGMSVLIFHIVRFQNIKAGNAYKEKKALMHTNAANKHIEKAHRNLSKLSYNADL